MKLQPCSLGLSAGILMGLGSLLFCLISMHTGYGQDVLKMWEAMHPGTTMTLGGCLIAFAYSFVEGFIWFWLFGHLYNRLVHRCHKHCHKDEMKS